MINNSINFTSKLFNDKKNKTKEEIKTSQTEEEDNSFEGTAKRVKQEDMKFTRDMIAGSLLAMSLLSAPFVYSSIEKDNFQGGVNVGTLITEEDQKIIDQASILSKEGKDSTVLEADEFRQLLNYSNLKDIPKLTRKNIEVTSMAGFIPVNMNTLKSDEEIIKQVRNVQFAIDHLAKKYKENPPKSYQERYADYAINNITDREILDKVDFSELEIYQKDLTLVKNAIRINRERIRRDDIDAKKKEEKAVQDAQKFVNSIVNRYKTRAQVSGNIDGNNTLTKFELAGLLNMESIKDLPDILQIKIINKALEDYNPRNLNHIKSSGDAERENEQVEQDKQIAQQKLNEWGIKAQKEFFHLLHPNEIAVWKHD